MMRTIIPFLAVAIAVLPGRAPAASTGWIDIDGGEARMVAIRHEGSNAIEGFVELKLAEGWKTYWRMPGENGIPPEFDFSGSEGFSLDGVAFQTPEIEETDDGLFAGYHGTVQFVFSGKAEGGPVSLRLDLLAGVCDEICIPATAQFEIGPEAMATPDGRSVTEIAIARASIPSAASDAFGLASPVELSSGLMVLPVRLPHPEQPATLVIEALDGTYLPLARKINTDGTVARFGLALPKSIDAAGAGERKFRYTLINGGKAVEGLFSPVAGNN